MAAKLTKFNILPISEYTDLPAFALTKSNKNLSWFALKYLLDEQFTG